MGALTSCACDSCGCPDDVPLSNKPETYSVPATESSDDSYTRDQLEPPKNKKKKKKNKKNTAALQHEIMQKAKNEINKHAASTSLYDMDSKTVKLLMSVDLNASQDCQVPQPSMPSIPSLDFDREPEISDLPDMSTALRSYTSSHMYDDANDLPDKFLSANNTFQQDVKDVSYERIATMKNLVAQTPKEMVTIIAAQYSTDKHVETDESQSSLDEDERLEIEQRKEDLNKSKHEKTMSVVQAKLFRMGTVTQWTGNDMEDMGGAIKKEIEAMRSGYHLDMDTDIDMDTDDLVTDEDFDDKQMEIDRKSELYRMKSARKWTTQRVERENEDMQAQLTHLMLSHQSSIESDVADPMKQANMLPLSQNKQ